MEVIPKKKELPILNKKTQSHFWLCVPCFVTFCDAPQDQLRTAPFMPELTSFA